MAVPKGIERGAPVEVQREVGKPWEPAAFESAVEEHRGWFRAVLPPTADPIVHAIGRQLFSTRSVYVPAQRIRVRMGTPVPGQRARSTKL